MTAAEALRAAIPRLAAAGVPDAPRDARRLLAHALQVAPDRLTLHLPDEVGQEAGLRLEAALAARVARQPVGQIVGERLFWGRSFRVTRDTLDPRPETECLIEAALAHPFATLLDLGTGTGCIALTLLAERPAARGIATDLSAAALDVAAGNALSLGLADRIEFRHSDWFADVSGKFDLILSNPPYIAEAEMADLAPEVRDWEPPMALTPGGDGLDAYRAIASGAPAHLLPGGRLLVEIGAGQGADVAALFAAAGLAEVRVLPDLDGRDRVVCARLPAGGLA
ncbi:peptide chain release factor N(5)-glutamine methyltransferase [Rhodobacter sp. NSM]|uniref:peptide chain release factor N(5)-glutamine methyltransferase n=1 Tax=Rhodobacter sp. NSM TaxID=3457501 RepID=UPI003FD38C26